MTTEARVDQLERLVEALTINVPQEIATVRAEMAQQRRDSLTPTERALEDYVKRPSDAEIKTWSFWKPWSRIEEGTIAVVESFLNRKVVQEPGYDKTPVLAEGFSFKLPYSRYIKISTKELPVTVTGDYVTLDGQKIKLTTQHFLRIQNSEKKPDSKSIYHIVRDFAKRGVGKSSPGDKSYAQAVWKVLYGVHGGLEQLPTTLQAAVQETVRKYTIEDWLNNTKRDAIYQEIKDIFTSKTGVDKTGLNNYGLVCDETHIGQLILPPELEAVYRLKEEASVRSDAMRKLADAQKYAIETQSGAARQGIIDLYNGLVDAIEAKFATDPKYKDKPLDAAIIASQAQSMMLLLGKHGLAGVAGGAQPDNTLVTANLADLMRGYVATGGEPTKTS